jgi:hypothetical protein
VEQAHAQVAFQQGHVAADRSRGQAELARCGGESAQLRAAHERFQVGEGFHEGGVFKCSLKVILAISG